MPTIYSETNDGNQAGAINSNWDTVHDHSGLFNPNISHASYNFAVGAVYISGRGSYFIRRSFFEFDDYLILHYRHSKMLLLFHFLSK